jgi:hypothetical protein
MPAYQRDPLSIQYDALCARLVSQGIANPYSDIVVRVRSPRGDYVDGGGLTAHERAFQRSLYRALNSTFGRAQQNPDWSLTRWWLSPSVVGGLFGLIGGHRERRLFFMITPKAAGRAMARRSGEQWARDPALQSGGIGSPKQRF